MEYYKGLKHSKRRKTGRGKMLYRSKRFQPKLNLTGFVRYFSLLVFPRIGEIGVKQVEVQGRLAHVRSSLFLTLLKTFKR